MRRVAALSGALLILAGPAKARSVPTHPSTVPTSSSRVAIPPAPSFRPAPAAAPYVRPAPPLPMLPSVARVRIETGRDRLLVYEDVSIPRGQWQSGALDLFVAFGAPGTPVAIDARLAPAQRSSDGTIVEGAGQAEAVELAPRAPPTVNLLLGTRRMAGVIVHLREGDLHRAFQGETPRSCACARSCPLRAPTPRVPAMSSCDSGLRRARRSRFDAIEVASVDCDRPIAHVEARLCGPESDTRQLTVVGWPVSLEASPSEAAPVAPSQAVRHVGDDLCVRWWSR